MEITGSALTALFVGLVWVLIKVVEYFISKKKKEAIEVSQDGVRVSDILRKLEKIDDDLEHITYEYVNLASTQRLIAERIEDIINKLNK